MNIEGKITGIKYKSVFADSLNEYNIDNYNVNSMPAACLCKNGQYSFAISKWVSPKRTRSYPFERVYNTLNIAKKITIIPIVKDEGIGGDRDFIQWDTVSLMSLLDVFVIFGYYNKAKKHSTRPNKITLQEFDNEYIIAKIREISQSHSSALHWNLAELNDNFHHIIDKTKVSYEQISNRTGVALHDLSGIDNFKEKIGNDVKLFMNFSRDKAQKAQAREVHTQQPKESLSSLSKAKITISNYLGGKYFFTVDEVAVEENGIYLIESKHSMRALLPNKSDIKDGLLKMILYCNLSEVVVDGQKMSKFPILKLTSPILKGKVLSSDKQEVVERFMLDNKFTNYQKEIVQKLFEEAVQNKFIVQIQHSK